MTEEWYYTTGGQQAGPVSWDDLRALAAQRKIAPGDHVWKEGMPEWAEARTAAAPASRRSCGRRQAREGDGRSRAGGAWRRGHARPDEQDGGQARRQAARHRQFGCGCPAAVRGDGRPPHHRDRHVRRLHVAARRFRQEGRRGGVGPV
ncbi:MAG: DUF4339 domain-containing protein, partial [Gemmataceae bacterium]|nr:DUF4339 domain-containing protein [Gemmataceae bacterium]